MRSLRSQILTYHLLAALVIASLASAAAVFALVQILGRNLNQTLNEASSAVPGVVAYFTARRGSLERAAPSIVSHLAGEGVQAIVVPHNHFPLPPPFGRPPHGPPLFPTPSMLLAGTLHVEVNVPGGIVLLGIDPRRVAWANAYVPLLASCIYGIVVCAGLAVGLSTAQRALEPLARTTSALTRLGDGDFEVEPVRTQDPSELGKLAKSYNRAVDTVRTAFAERARAEAEMQQFVADAGHQLRTPLTVIMGHLSALSLQQTDPRTDAALDNMLIESRRMRNLIEDLILLTRLDEEPADQQDFVDLCALVSEFASAQSGDSESFIRLGRLDEASIEARLADMHSALAALVDNASKYAPASPIEVDLRRVGSTVELRVMDRGPGMSPQDLEHAADRFYRGQASANAPGSGLGLAIIRRIVQRAGGSLSLQNRLGGGLECRLTFPLFPAMLAVEPGRYAEARQAL
jgi:signal transduction histidine kinase